MRAIVIFLSGLIAWNAMSQHGNQICSTADIVTHGIVSARVEDSYLHPDQITAFTVKPVPLAYYNQVLIVQQEDINDRSEFVISNVRFSDQRDEEDITPLTWKWVDLEMKREDGTMTYMSLRRPNQWIAGRGIKEGRQVYFDWEDVGAQGWALVKAIRPNQLDSRLIKNESDSLVIRPITGKFQHTSNHVLDLSFDNEPDIGVTGNHPIWSLDRNTWIEAENLRLGEQVALAQGCARLTNMKRRPGRHPVYNIEVYRSHNYHVARQAVVVHNGPCIGNRTVKEVVGDATITYQGRTYKVYASTGHIRAKFVEHYAKLMAEGKFNWNDMRRAADFSENTNKLGSTEIDFVLTPDGKAILTEGHTRFVASRLAGVDIPIDNPDVVVISHGDFRAADWDFVQWNRSPKVDQELWMEKYLRGMTDDDK